MKFKILFLLTILSLNVFANDGFYGLGKAGSLIPLKNSYVSMESEIIEIDVYLISSGSIAIEYNCTFNFINDSDTSQELQIGFPIDYGYYAGAMEGISIGSNDVNDFSVYIDGKKSPFEWYMQGINKDFNDIKQYDEVYGFNTSLEPNQQKQIINTYSMISSVGAGLGSLKVEYIVLSALTWKRPIQSAEFIINFHFPTQFDSGADDFEKIIHANEHVTLKRKINNFTPKNDIRIILQRDFDNYFEVELANLDEYIEDNKINNIKYPSRIFELLKDRSLSKDDNKKIYQAINDHYNDYYINENLSLTMLEVLQSEVKYKKNNDLLELNFDLINIINNYHEKNIVDKIDKINTITAAISNDNIDEDLYYLTLKAFSIYEKINREIRKTKNIEKIRILDNFEKNASIFCTNYIYNNYLKSNISPIDIIVKLGNDFSGSNRLNRFGNNIISAMNKISEGNFSFNEAKLCSEIIDIIFHKNKDVSWKVQYVISKDSMKNTHVEELRNVLYELGNYYYDYNIDKSISYYHNALDLTKTNIDSLMPFEYIDYNLSCAYSKTRKIDLSLKHLKKSLDNGYSSFNWLLKDPDLENLRILEESKFNDLINLYK